MLFSHQRGSSFPQAPTKLLSFLITFSQVLQKDLTASTLVCRYHLTICCLKEDKPEGSHGFCSVCREGSNSLHLRPECKIWDWFWTAQNTLDCTTNCILFHGPRDLTDQRAFSSALVCFLQLAHLWLYTPRNCGSSLKSRANIKLARTDAVPFSSQKPSGWHVQPSHFPPAGNRCNLHHTTTHSTVQLEESEWHA